MKIKFKDLIKSSSILSLPGFISIFISLLSIPIHLNYAGSENYGNYIIFHFVLMISINLNLGIGKSTAISVNNFRKKSQEISYESVIYTRNIACVIFFIFIFLFILKNLSIYDYNNFYSYTSYLFLGSIITIFFITFEGILQGYKKFKSISLLNLFFFSFSISVPSILLIYNKNLNLDDLILISILIKFFTILIMSLIIKNNNLIKKGKSRILFKNLKKNSKWITLNSLLVQFYDLFDKYLIKIFLGPIAVASYSIPQQLTGKLSIISKSFCAFLLPDLSSRRINNQAFEFSLYIFIRIVPIIIFLIMPLYPLILKFWLSNSYSDTIYNLTKIFSLSVIFSCISHILVTKFEASKTLYRNLKIELILMPVFLITLYFFTSENYNLLIISLLILLKEIILLFLRLNFLRSEIKQVNSYYLFSIYFLLILFLSFHYKNLYYISIIPLVLSIFRK